MIEWQYEKDIAEWEPMTEQPKGYIGFIYCVTLKDGNHYIGKKLFKKGWQDYIGSSKKYKKSDVAYKQIWYLCKTRTEMAAKETMIILSEINKDECLNEIVHCRIRIQPHQKYLYNQWLSDMDWIF